MLKRAADDVKELLEEDPELKKEENQRMLIRLEKSHVEQMDL